MAETLCEWALERSERAISPDNTHGKDRVLHDL